MRVLGNSAGGMPASAGFTLIELMVVLTIVAILTVIGLPSLTDFVAEQRVRTVASDLVSEIVFARVKAVELSRRVIMEQLPGGWDKGWRIYADQNNNASYDAGTDTDLKIFNGFGGGAASATGRLYTCSTVGDFATQIIFRPDGHQPVAGGHQRVELLGAIVGYRRQPAVPGR